MAEGPAKAAEVKVDVVSLRDVGVKLDGQVVKAATPFRAELAITTFNGFDQHAQPVRSTSAQLLEDPGDCISPLYARETFLARRSIRSATAPARRGACRQA